MVIASLVILLTACGGGDGGGGTTTSSPPAPQPDLGSRSTPPSQETVDDVCQQMCQHVIATQCGFPALDECLGNCQRLYWQPCETQFRAYASCITTAMLTCQSGRVVTPACTSVFDALSSCAGTNICPGFSTGRHCTHETDCGANEHCFSGSCFSNVAGTPCDSVTDCDANQACAKSCCY
jgi:hypothetical protein